MRRLWLRWLVLAVFLVVLISAFVVLGRWQLDRLETQRAENAQVAAQQELPPVGAEQALAETVTDAEQWQRVRLRGAFDPDHQLLARHRRNGEARGYEVLTPLRLADGRSVLVSRGFVDLDGGPLPTTLPEPPSGEVAVEGWLRRNEVGRDTLLQPAENSVRLVSTPTLATTGPEALVTTGWVAAYDVGAEQTGGLQPLLAPTPTEGNHFSYALQWFAFSGIAIVGVVVLVRGDLRERHRQRSGVVAGGGGQSRGTRAASPRRAPSRPPADPPAPGRRGPEPPEGAGPPEDAEPHRTAGPVGRRG